MLDAHWPWGWSLPHSGLQLLHQHQGNSRDPSTAQGMTTVRVRRVSQWRYSLKGALSCS